MRYNYTIFKTELGYIGLVASPAGLRRVIIDPSKEGVERSISEEYPDAIESRLAFKDLPDRIERYINGERVTFDDGLDLSGVSEFRCAVCQATRAFPYGETRSYAWLARRIGKPKAARAVGQALAANPTPIVVPCHRVIGSDGRLIGFTGGLDMKRRLLEIEGQRLTGGAVR